MSTAVGRAAAELGFAPVRVTCEVNRPELVHCAVRPQYDPPPRRGGCLAAGGEADSSGVPAGRVPADRTGRAAAESESVVVSAPTSSGKTTVAISALEAALRDPEARAVFCAPIKALSNQMFSEFHRRFPGKVGLMTGDHSISPSSPILVATTEIVRCLLHVDAEFSTRLRTIIFDEVHYLSDSERGPAWEESIVLLAPGVSIVCLSATIRRRERPGQGQARAHGPEARAASPSAALRLPDRRRPRRRAAAPRGPRRRRQGGPRRHRRGGLGRAGVAQAVPGGRSAGCTGRRAGRARARAQARRLSGAEPGAGAGRRAPAVPAQAPRGPRQAEEDGPSHRVLLPEEGLRQPRPAAPVLGRAGEAGRRERAKSRPDRSQADQGPAALDSRGRQAALRATQVVHGGSEDELLPSGIGVHHGGVVPFAREITEVLFKQGLLDVLFCTETFGMGLNMPARVVVFHFRPRQPLTKFDGQGQRFLTPLEYQQMSGRAGRRQLDTHGTSIVTLDDTFDPNAFAAMLDRPSPPVCSRYEMQASSALRLLKHGPQHMWWFVSQTLLQFEERERERRDCVLLKPLEALKCAMADPAIGLLDSSGHPTQLGLACSACESSDALLMARLLSAGCLQSADPVDLAAYLTAFVLERGGPEAGGAAEERAREHPGLWALKRWCQERKRSRWTAPSAGPAWRGRRTEDDGTVAQRLQERGHLAEAFKATWLNFGTLDDTAVATGLDSGSLARLVRRMDECGRQLTVAMRILGDSAAASGLEAVLGERLRRGLPFCESLYFPEELRGRSDEVLDGLMAAERSGDPWACPHAPGSQVRLDPREVGFSHNTIKRCFQEGDHDLSGVPIRTAAAELLRGERSVEDFCLDLKVVSYNGLWFTLGNRRLATLRLLAMLRQRLDDQRPAEFPFTVASRAEATEWCWESKFTTGTFRGARVIIRETGEVLGQGLLDSLISLDEEDSDWYADQERARRAASGISTTASPRACGSQRIGARRAGRTRRRPRRQGPARATRVLRVRGARPHGEGVPAPRGGPAGPGRQGPLRGRHRRGRPGPRGRLARARAAGCRSGGAASDVGGQLPGARRAGRGRQGQGQVRRGRAPGARAGRGG
ncbi:unnamed protein product [Prorocentrum cordatum]|uniref:RNA helicase n=1 Tax=Prorocentrum cordatum TaxID=2364126 RepID=A0ABN9VPZ3_9DINO|nr:unnamed protein product [Polarella glacialis]